MHVESNALNNLKLKIFKITDERVLFYSNNPDLLPPEPKLSFRYLEQGIQEFHRKYVLALADKASNNDVVVWRFQYISTLIQELDSTITYERVSPDERFIVNTHSTDITAKSCLIENSSSYTTTSLSKLLTSLLSKKNKKKNKKKQKNIGLDWIRYYDTVYERDGINYFWSI